MSKPDDRSRYSEAQLREIIARASVPDRPSYSVRDVREIGAELGLDLSAIDTAIVQVTESAARSNLRALGFARYATYGGTLGFTGAASVLTPGVEGIAIIACGAMTALSICLTRGGQVPGSPASMTFLRRNFVAWGSFLVGGTTFARLANPTWLGNDSTSVGLTVAGLWILSSLIGSLVARRSRPPEDPRSQAESRPPWRTRLATRIKGWVDAVLLPFAQVRRRPIHVTKLRQAPY
jgi:hypothetical protein